MTEGRVSSAQSMCCASARNCASASRFARRYCCARSMPYRLAMSRYRVSCCVVSTAVVPFVMPSPICRASSSTLSMPRAVSCAAHSTPAMPPPITHTSVCTSSRSGSPGVCVVPSVQRKSIGSGSFFIFSLGFAVLGGICALTQKCRRRLPAAFAIAIWNVTACFRRSRGR